MNLDHFIQVKFFLVKFFSQERSFLTNLLIHGIPKILQVHASWKF